MKKKDDLANSLFQFNPIENISKANKLASAYKLRTEELEIAIKELAFQNQEKEKRAAELDIANKELVFQNQEKEKRAAELIIANKELVFQNKEKEKRALELILANKELMVFNFISNHDFQEPLRKIQIFSDKILRDEIDHLSENGKNYFNKILNSAARMRQLMEALLEYSNTSLTNLKFEKMDLGAMVNIVLVGNKEIIEIKKAKIVIENSAKINVIPQQFIHLIQHIINNSLKFSSYDKTPYIFISYHKVKFEKTNEYNIPLNKYHHHIRIADNGIGFDNQYNEKIFGLFQKLENKEDYEGIGMGLAIVKKIVAIHYGFISAVSEKDKGTIMNIFLPI